MTKKFGAWRSPVAHHNGVVGVASSNLVAPTFTRQDFYKKLPTYLLNPFIYKPYFTIFYII